VKLPILTKGHTQQQTALKQLLMGVSITQAAQAAGVTRQTVSEWCNHHRTGWGLHQKRVNLVARAERTELERAPNAAYP